MAMGKSHKLQFLLLPGQPAHFPPCVIDPLDYIPRGMAFSKYLLIKNKCLMEYNVALSKDLKINEKYSVDKAVCRFFCLKSIHVYVN